MVVSILGISMSAESSPHGRQLWISLWLRGGIEVVESVVKRRKQFQDASRSCLGNIPYCKLMYRDARGFQPTDRQVDD